MLTALVAAGCVHALILLSISDSRILVNGGLSQLQVELVATDNRQQQGAQTDDSAHATTQDVAAETESEMTPTIEEGSQQSEQPLAEVAYHVADPVGEREALSEAANPMLAPSSVQAAILAQVSYPHLARRRGWEGQVQLRFEVSNRAVREIALLQPCEHAVLNEAAQEGLRRMHSVSLADGRYWLPVVFKLRESGL